MRRSNFKIKILIVPFLIFAWCNFVAAQQIAVDKTALAKFERSIETGNYQTIERALLDYAIAHPAEAKAFELLGNLRQRQNRLREAKSLYQKAVALDGRLAAARINLAALNLQIGDAAQAISDLNEIADEQIANAALRLKLAQVYALAGDCRKAEIQIEKLDAQIKNGDALPLRAACYLQSNEQQKVVALIPAAKNLVGQNPATALKFAEVLSANRLYREASNVLSAVVTAAPQNADALIALAKTQIYAKDFSAAESNLKKAAKANPNQPELLLVRGLLESERGNAAQALDLVQKSLAANPDSTEVLTQFVVAAMRANNAARAFDAAEKLLKMKPHEPEFLYLHGAAALQKNDLPAAEKSLTQFVEARPQNVRGCLALGLTFAAQADKLEAARKQLRRCIEIAPQNFEAKYQLGLSYKSQGEIAKAIEYLEAATKDAPDYAAALRDLGAVYLQAGAEAKARRALEKAVALDPNDADTHFQLGRLYNLSGETELAKKHLEVFQKLKSETRTK